MIKQVLKGQAGLLAVAAVTFCGATLYGAGKLLELLFKDVDPDKLEEKLKETEARLKAAEAAESGEAPAGASAEAAKKSASASAVAPKKSAPASAVAPKKSAPAGASAEAASAKAAPSAAEKGEDNMIDVYCYNRCSTCRKALAWLDENGVKYNTIDIVKDHPNKTKLKKYHKMSGLPLKKFFNTSGKIYREMELSSKLKDMSQDEQLKLLASDGMLVKRPLVIGDGFVLVGFKEEDWAKTLL